VKERRLWQLLVVVDGTIVDGACSSNSIKHVLANNVDTLSTSGGIVDL
jgi:hypothetical protein